MEISIGYEELAGLLAAGLAGLAALWRTARSGASEGASEGAVAGAVRGLNGTRESLKRLEAFARRVEQRLDRGDRKFDVLDGHVVEMGRKLDALEGRMDRGLDLQQDQEVRLRVIEKTEDKKS